MAMRRMMVVMVLLLSLLPGFLYGFNVEVETIDGEHFTLRQFSMGGRKTFSVDQEGGIGRIDWNEIELFEIKNRGGIYWIELTFIDGKKGEFSLRHYAPFQGRSELGTMLIPFEKVKRVSFLRERPNEKKREDLGIKESPLSLESPPPRIDRIVLRNGDILVGDVLFESLRVRTVYGLVVFKKEDVSRLSFGKRLKSQKEGGEKDVLISKYGDKISGLFLENQLKVMLRNQTEIVIPREHIQEIEFALLPEVESKILRESESR